ncbi:hypothetical protein SODALDRAFT_331298 [Sodiomyces alkalinus F11]|uniref:Ureidoglycolate hydrolase n=1 Tax=Sodiomyces alkalinus (strain CBS 110278 / VKM F-3762 / F11) TaxID=1314773 RepID=A0A3N2Q463_SODAK|nr:hypothetical protein SODALDRAFT_331298 [Sodiomyces alkalinus F11]ROT41550.1 hypothetical protein SODALDRAFT_331298 [Sodiomyces alkalinus F11]
MAPIRITLDKSNSLAIPAQPLTPAEFAPFGSVVQNPHPSIHPSPSLPTNLAYNAVSANQGTAIKYQHLSRPLDLYASAPSKVSSKPVLNIFVCAARPLRLRPPPLPSSSSSSSSSSSPSPSPSPLPPRGGAGLFLVTILERHPFTTQTFVPLAQGPAAPASSYLVIVAPSLPPGPLDQHLPFPPSSPPSSDGTGDEKREEQSATVLPARGVPDLRNLRAFIAGPGQGVTYGAGTWHAPMVALGPPGAVVEFAVTQFANGVGEEDCQEVIFGDRQGEGEGEGEIVVEVPGQIALAKL